MRNLFHHRIASRGDQAVHLEELHAPSAREVVDRLTITGIFERDYLAQHVAACDIAVIPNVNRYASPLKLFEYLQLGRASVGPDKEKIRERI